MDVKDLFNYMKVLGIRPKKRLSQVLLVDKRFLRKIAKIVYDEVSSYRPILELGAGPGNLTMYLLSEGLDVIAIEIDYRFAPLLNMIKKEFGCLEVAIADALSVLEWPNIPRVVVGNLPYHISSDLLIAIARSKIEKAVVTLQKEVAERIVAKPGTDAYGRLSVIMQTIFKARIALYIPNKAFKPVPEVSSATVVLERIRAYDNVVHVLETVTRCLFSYRNKLAHKALRKCFPKTLEAMHDWIKKLERVRVYEMHPEDFLEIARMCVEVT